MFSNIYIQIPNIQEIIQIPGVYLTSITRFFVSHCQIQKGSPWIKYSSSSFNIGMKVDLTWQFSRNNHSDMSKMVHVQISTLFKNDEI